MYVETGNEKFIDDLSDRIKNSYYRNNKHIQSILEMSKIHMGNCYDINKEPIKPVWKSFDENTYNFHISPEVRRQDEKIKTICQQITPGKRLRRGSMPWTRNHWWIEIEKDSDGFCYVLSFQTLAYDNHSLNCYLDWIQFYKYHNSFRGPNWCSDNTFRILYPKFGESCIDERTKNSVVSTGLSLNDEVEKIVSEFRQFMSGN